MDVTVSGDADLRRLVVDLGKASRELSQRADEELGKGAERLADNLKQQAASSGSFKAMAGTITHDRVSALSGPQYEIGPDRARGGAASLLGFFFGWPNGGGGAGDLDGPMKAEGDRLGTALGGLLGDVL